MEFQKIVRDIEYLTRIYISAKYLQCKKSIENCETKLQTISGQIEGNKGKIEENSQRSVQIDNQVQEILEKIDKDSGGQLQEIEKELQAKSKEESQALGAKKSSESGLESEKKKLKSLEKSIKDDEQFLKSKINEMDKVEGLFETLKKADEDDTKAYQTAQKRYEALNAGLLTNEKGEATSLQEELISK